jgi:hypothetical protein
MLLNGTSTNTTCTGNHELHNGLFTTRHQVLDVIDDIFGRSLPEDALALKQLVEASRNIFGTQGTKSGCHSIPASRKRKVESHEMEPKKKLEQAISDIRFPDQNRCHLWQKRKRNYKTLFGWSRCILLLGAFRILDS